MSHCPNCEEVCPHCGFVKRKPNHIYYPPYKPYKPYDPYKPSFQPYRYYSGYNSGDVQITFKQTGGSDAEGI